MARGGAHVLLISALLVLVTLAGCASQGDAKDTDGSLKAVVIDDGNSEAVLGRVEGFVLHSSGAPLPDSHVTILSVDHSTSTNGEGGFVFEDVPAGDQVLRIERENYQTLQKSFEVVAGKLTRLEIVLAPVGEGGFTDHFHNRWRGKETLTVFEGTLKFDDDTEQMPPYECGYGKNGAAKCVNLYIVPEEGQIVPPGTNQLTVDVEFEPGALFEEETMKFHIIPAINFDPGEFDDGAKRESQGLASGTFPIASGSEQFEYEVHPLTVDHGHATWTDWQFRINWQPADRNFPHPWYNSLFRSPVDVTITAHKGALELDPPHPRFWHDTDRLEMEVSEPTFAYCHTVSEYQCANRNPSVRPYTYSGKTTCSMGCMTLAAGQVVPPGTTRVEFTVEHYWGDNADVPPAKATFEEDEFVIGYKSANASVHQATWDDYKWLEASDTFATDDGVAWRYEIEVEDTEADPYYQRSTRWIIMPAVPGHEDAGNWNAIECGREACGYAYFRLLEFTAINDDRDAMMGDA